MRLGPLGRIWRLSGAIYVFFCCRRLAALPFFILYICLSFGNLILVWRANGGDFFPMAPFDSVRLEVSAPRIVDLFRNHASQGAPVIEDVIGIVARNFRRPPPGRPCLLRLGDPGTYLKCYAGAPSIGVFPNSSRPPFAGPPNCSSKRVAWLRMSLQVKGYLVDPFWANSS